MQGEQVETGLVNVPESGLGYPTRNGRKDKLGQGPRLLAQELVRFSSAYMKFLWTNLICAVTGAPGENPSQKGAE